MLFQIHRLLIGYTNGGQFDANQSIKRHAIGYRADHLICTFIDLIWFLFDFGFFFSNFFHHRDIVCRPIQFDFGLLPHFLLGPARPHTFGSLNLCVCVCVCFGACHFHTKSNHFHVRYLNPICILWGDLQNANRKKRFEQRVCPNRIHFWPLHDRQFVAQSIFRLASKFVSFFLIVHDYTF